MKTIDDPGYLRQILESSMDGFWIVDLDGRIRAVNDAYCRMVGYTRDELLKMKISDVEDVETPDRIAEHLRLIIAKCQQRFETRHRRKDSTLVELEVSTNFQDHDGGLIVAFFRDITDRNRDEERIRASEVRYRTLFNSANDALFVMDGEKFVDCNPQAERLYGVGRDQIINRSPLDFSPTRQPDGRDSREKAGEKIHHARTREAQTFEWQHRRNDGTLFDVEVSLNKMNLGDGTLLLAVVRDITERKQAEEALRGSEAKFRSLFETMAQGVVYQDNNGRIIDANPAAERILGYSLQQLQGRTSKNPAWQSIMEDNSEFHGAEHPSMVALATGKPVKDAVMGVYNPRLKEYRWMNIDAVPEFEPGESKPRRVYTTFTDITERKRAEEALRESVQKFRNIVDTSPMGMHLYRLESDDRLVFTGANPAANQILNVDLGPYVGKTIEEAFPPLVHTEVPGEYRRIARHGGIWQTEQIEYEDDFIRGAYEVYAFQTEPGAMAAMFLDITERKRTENALRESEERFRAVFESAQDPIIIKNRELNYTHVNPATARLFARSITEIVGQTARDLFDEEAAVKLSADDTRVLDGEISEDEFSFRFGNIVRTFDVVKVPLRDSAGGITGLCAINRDITERKRSEKKMHAYQVQLRALSAELLRTEERERRKIASDLHDSICQYLALAQVKLSTLEKTTTPSGLTEIKESIHNLLDLALTEARSLTNELSPPMLYHVGLESAIVSLAEQLQKQYGLRIEVQCPEEKINIADEDLRAALFRATRELLINIVKHSQAGWAKVTLRRNKNSLLIEVNDTGVGFDFANIEKQQRQKGGFGLFSIEERLNHLGGNMDISSQPGKGTLVNISVPLEVDQPVGSRTGDK